MTLGGKAEPARGGEIERFGIAGDLADDEGQLAAAQAFLQREQRVFGALRRDMDQAVAQRRRQARTIRPAGEP